MNFQLEVRNLQDGKNEQIDIIVRPYYDILKCEVDM